MKKAISSFAVLALLSVGVFNPVKAGDCNYLSVGERTLCASPNECGFSYDFVELAYMYSDYASVSNSHAFADAGLPNGSVVDQMKGTNIQFMKSIDFDFYGVGQFYKTDGPLSSQVFYYRAGLGYHQAIMQSLDFTIEAGGLYSNCESSGKTLDEWGWYVSPGLRLSVLRGNELYGNYMYENFESMDNHRFEGGAVIPIINCVSVKLGGRYETVFEKASFLAGLRISY